MIGLAVDDRDVELQKITIGTSQKLPSFIHHWARDRIRSSDQMISRLFCGGDDRKVRLPTSQPQHSVLPGYKRGSITLWSDAKNQQVVMHATNVFDARIIVLSTKPFDHVWCEYHGAKLKGVCSSNGRFS